MQARFRRLALAGQVTLYLVQAGTGRLVPDEHVAVPASQVPAPVANGLRVDAPDLAQREPLALGRASAVA